MEKYQEKRILKEIEEYIEGTYSQHYSLKNNIQALDVIDSLGSSSFFCRDNALKYLMRYGKKNGKNKIDLIKSIHYLILLYHFDKHLDDKETL